VVVGFKTGFYSTDQDGLELTDLLSQSPNAGYRQALSRLAPWVILMLGGSREAQDEISLSAVCSSQPKFSLLKLHLPGHHSGELVGREASAAF
jgi:hypothetical protein